MINLYQISKLPITDVILVDTIIVHFKRLGSPVSHDSFNQYLFFFFKTMYILQNKCNIHLREFY